MSNSKTYTAKLDTSGQPLTATVVLPRPLPTEAPETVKLPDGRIMKVVPYAEPDEITTFSRSQLQRMDYETYQKLQPQIELAESLNLITDDLTSPEVRGRQEAALRESGERIRMAVAMRDAKAATQTTYKAWEDAKAALSLAERSGDSYEQGAAHQRLAEAQTAFSEANRALRELQQMEE